MPPVMDAPASRILSTTYPFSTYSSRSSTVKEKSKIQYAPFAAGNRRGGQVAARLEGSQRNTDIALKSVKILGAKRCFVGN